MSVNDYPYLIILFIWFGSIFFGAVLGWSKGYREGLNEGHKRGRSSAHASLAKVVDINGRR